MPIIKWRHPTEPHVDGRPARTENYKIGFETKLTVLVSENMLIGKMLNRQEVDGTGITTAVR